MRQRQSIVQRMSSAGGSFLQRSSSALQRSSSALQQANSNFYALNQQLSSRWSSAVKLVNRLPSNFGESTAMHGAAAAAAAAGDDDVAGIAAKAAARRHAAKKAALLLLAVRHLACLVQVRLAECADGRSMLSVTAFVMLDRAVAESVDLQCGTWRASSRCVVLGLRVGLDSSSHPLLPSRRVAARLNAAD
jgi:hypothetical protein